MLFPYDVEGGFIFYVSISYIHEGGDILLYKVHMVYVGTHTREKLARER